MKTLLNIKILLVLIVVFSTVKSFGQSINLGPAISATPSSTILVPLNVNSMNNIGAMDIRILFDNTVLSFVGTENLSPEAAGILSNAIVISGNTSRVNLSWLSMGTSGVNFQNGKFLDLKFNYISGNSNLNFDLLECEVVDWDGDIINVSYTNTTVSQQFTLNTYNVGGSGSYCQGGSGLTVTLDGSQVGVNYQIKKGGVNDGPTIPGTGGPLSWNNKTAGTYTVEARYGSDFLNMNGSAVITTTSNLPVSVSIQASALSVPFGSDITFTATPTNGGTNPSYQWKVNGNNAGTNSSTFTYTPSNQDVVSCVMTSNLGGCITNNPATSNSITITVTQTSSINLGQPIVAAPNTEVLVPVNFIDMNNVGAMDLRIRYDSTVLKFDTLVNLSADASGIIYNPVNVGGSIKQLNMSWLAQGTSGVNFANGKFLDIKFTYYGGSSNIYFYQADCEVADWNGYIMNINYSNTDISQAFTVNTYNVGGSGSYCQGTNGVTVTLDGSQVGVNYQIKKGGVNDGPTIPGTGNPISWNNKTAGTYTVEARYGSTFVNMNGSAIVTVTPNTPVSVSISANTTNVVQGGNVTLTATPVNGGTNPSYQWLVNNNNAGINSNTFTYSPNNLDNVKCIMTSNLGGCLSNNPATSNTITINVSAPVANVNLGNTISAAPQTQILVPVNMSNLNNTGAIDLRILYDSTKLTYVDIVNLSASATGTLANPTNVTGTTKQLNISWVADNSGVNPNGKFLDIKFNYAGGNTNLTFNQAQCEITTWDGINVNTNYTGVNIKPVVVWTGNTNNSWELSSNWVNNVLPGANDEVLIPAVVANYPTVNVQSTINKLTIESSATATGSLLDNGNLTVTNNSNVKRYISGNKWHLISSPVANALSGVFHLSTGQANIYIREYNPANNTWSFISNTSTPLSVGKGYGIWADTQTNNTPDPVVSFNGQFNTGSINIPLVPGAWNIIGNPYPSAIDWDLVNKTPNLLNNGAAYFWKQSLAGGNGAYAMYDGTIATNGATNIIPPMQGFFVKANTNSLTFDNTIRLHTTQQLYNKSSNSINDMIRITASNGADYTDEAVVLFNNNATNGFDNQLDALKLFSNNTNLPEVYTLADNNSIAINRFGSYPAAIPMNVRLGVSAHITLTASEFDNFDSNISIKLEDMQTGIIQDLRQNPVYSFTANIGENDNRFVLHFAIITGISENNVVNVSIYSYDKTIYVNTNEKIKDISVYNMLGQLITSVAGNGKSLQTVNVEHSTAYYLVKVTTDKGVRTEKVFIK